MTPDRKTRCRYLRRNGDRCQNEAASYSHEDEVVMCGKHMYRAHLVWLRYYRAARARTA